MHKAQLNFQYQQQRSSTHFEKCFQRELKSTDTARQQYDEARPEHNYRRSIVLSVQQMAGKQVGGGVERAGMAAPSAGRREAVSDKI